MTETMIRRALKPFLFAYDDEAPTEVRGELETIVAALLEALDE